MNIPVSGRRKNGSPATLCKIAAGLPNCQVFSGGGGIGKHLGDHEKIVYKHTPESEKARLEVCISCCTRS